MRYKSRSANSYVVLFADSCIFSHYKIIFALKTVSFYAMIRYYRESIRILTFIAAFGSIIIILGIFLIEILFCRCYYYIHIKF